MGKEPMEGRTEEQLNGYQLAPVLFCEEEYRIINEIGNQA